MSLRADRSTVLSLLALSVILVSFAVYLTKDIDRPWVDNVDFNGAVWSQAAHNILRAGLIETQGASSAFYFGPLPIPSTRYYLHHPPLLHLGVAAVFAVFGEHEWAARMIPIGCSLASVVLLWLLVANCLGMRTATFCAAAFTALPMALRYGTMVNFEPVVLLLILVALLALRYWEQSERPLWKAVFLASLLVGMWVDWAMHIFALVLFAWWISRPSRDTKRLAWIILAMTVISGLLYFVRIQILRPDALHDLQKAFFVRISSDQSYRFTEWQWVCKIGNTIVHHFLWGGLIATAAGAIVTFQRRKQAGFAWLGWTSFMVFAMDAVFVGVFQNDSYIHKYIGFYFVAPVSIMAGIALNEVIRAIDRRLEGAFRAVGTCAAGAMVIVGILFGRAQANAFEGRFCILDLQKKEAETLVPMVGEAIQKHFSPQTKILCNFMPYYGPQLEYYAEREIASNLGKAEYWKPFIQHTTGDVGGIVWMGANNAQDIVSHLPPGKKEFVRLDNESFCLWKPVTGVGGSDLTSFSTGKRAADLHTQAKGS